MAQPEPMTTATSTSGVTTDCQPVDAGSNPKKRKMETECKSEYVELCQDLVQLEKMKSKYMKLCRALKRKYSKVIEEELNEGPLEHSYSYHKDRLSQYPLNVHEAAEIVREYGWDIIEG